VARILEAVWTCTCVVCLLACLPCLLSRARSDASRPVWLAIGDDVAGRHRSGRESIIRPGSRLYSLNPLHSPASILLKPQSSVHLHTYTRTYDLRPRLRYTTSKYAFHRLRPVQDRPRHLPASPRRVPRARLQCGFLHQHPADHPGLHSRTSPNPHHTNTQALY
jgi:hypothetical protein